MFIYVKDGVIEGTSNDVQDAAQVMLEGANVKVVFLSEPWRSFWRSLAPVYDVVALDNAYAVYKYVPHATLRGASIEVVWVLEGKRQLTQRQYETWSKQYSFEEIYHMPNS